MAHENKINGKFKWIKPLFSKVRYHDVPRLDADGNMKTTRVWVKSGTQIIDRCWRELRKHVGNYKVVGSKNLRDKVRSAQWCYWNRGSDWWAATGDMFRHGFDKTYAS